MLASYLSHHLLSFRSLICAGAECWKESLAASYGSSVSLLKPSHSSDLRLMPFSVACALTMTVISTLPVLLRPCSLAGSSSLMWLRNLCTWPDWRTLQTSTWTPRSAMHIQVGMVHVPLYLAIMPCALPPLPVMVCLISLCG